jgi:hypothetical protein
MYIILKQNIKHTDFTLIFEHIYIQKYDKQYINFTVTITYAFQTDDHESIKL